MTENNGRVWQKKVISKKNQGLQHRGGKRRKEVGTLSQGNDKNNIFVNYLFIKLVFVLKLLGLKGYLKSRINKLPRKSINFLLEDADD